MGAFFPYHRFKIIATFLQFKFLQFYGCNLLTKRRLLALIEKVIARAEEKQGVKQDKWISGEETMKNLRNSSKTTL